MAADYVGCDYIINYYYIQLNVQGRQHKWRCDYIINYYYIQYNERPTKETRVVITL